MRFLILLPVLLCVSCGSITPQQQAALDRATVIANIALTEAVNRHKISEADASLVRALGTAAIPAKEAPTTPSGK